MKDVGDQICVAQGVQAGFPSPPIFAMRPFRTFEYRHVALTTSALLRARSGGLRTGRLPAESLDESNGDGVAFVLVQHATESGPDGQHVTAVAEAMNELWNGCPSTVPATLTRPRVPKNSAVQLVTTNVQPPRAALFCRRAVKVLSTAPPFVDKGTLAAVVTTTPRR
jgi:hypothetical protein